MAFNVLIDYYNVELLDQKNGLIYIAEKILNKLGPAEVAEKNVTVRLYGGWYENNKITKRAQILNAEIVNTFPTQVQLSDNKSTVIVNAELAMSLTSSPKFHLVDTVRRNGIPSGLKANHPIRYGCSRAHCPVVLVHNFVDSGKCSECTNVKVEDIFYRQEQKLVDTMLITDMIEIGRREKKYCIVSSDDDFWPGILSSVSSGCEVYHFHTKYGRQTPAHYMRSATNNYHMNNL